MELGGGWKGGCARHTGAISIDFNQIEKMLIVMNSLTPVPPRLGINFMGMTGNERHKNI